MLCTYLLLSLYPQGGIYAYIVPTAAWAGIAILTVAISGKSLITSKYRKGIVALAGAVALAHILIQVDAALFTGFGKNPLSLAPLNFLLNASLLSSTILGIELSRAFVVNALSKRRPVLLITSVSLMYAIIYSSLFQMQKALSFTDPLFSVSYLGGTFIPAFAVNLFATFLTLIGGPLASLSYRFPIMAFTWFSPILPDLSWGFKALLETIPPTLGFLYVGYAIRGFELRRAGVISGSQKRVSVRKQKEERASLFGWAGIAVVGTVAVFFSTGLLNVYPVVVVSGSMTPSIDVGSLAILTKASAGEVRVGDVIEYYRDGMPVLHRVIEIRSEGGTTYFVTKGDANPTPDPLVSSRQVTGKLVTSVPYIGFVPLVARQLLSTALELVSGNLILLSAPLVTAGALGVFYALRRRA